MGVVTPASLSKPDIFIFTAKNGLFRRCLSGAFPKGPCGISLEPSDQATGGNRGEFVPVLQFRRDTPHKQAGFFLSIIRIGVPGSGRQAISMRTLLRRYDE